MSKITAELVGKTIAHWWERAEGRLRHPDAYAEMIDIEPALAAFMKAGWDQIVDSFEEGLRSRAIEPAQVWLCNVRTREEYEVYPDTEQMRQTAAAYRRMARRERRTGQAEAFRDQELSTMKEIQAVKLHRGITSAINQEGVRVLRLVRVAASRHIRRVCQDCRGNFSPGDPILRDPGSGRVWCSPCASENPALQSALSAG